MANSTNIALTAPFLVHARPFPAIVVGGLIVGVLDLSYAIAVYSPYRPIRVPQTIASGILGMKSYSGDAALLPDQSAGRSGPANYLGNFSPC
jgi:hypothetical protein